MKYRTDIDEKAIQDAIKEDCVLRLKTLDTLDRKIVKVLSESDGFSVKQILERLDITISTVALSDRCESLVLDGTIRRRHQRVGKKKPITFYYLPDYVKVSYSNL